MSTAIQSYQPDTYGRLVAEGVVENAVFSSFYNLIMHRRSEGYTKAMLAERMNVDRATVTKLTSRPTNMKISTVAALANALDADICFLLVDRNSGSYYFSSVGTHVRTLQNISSVGVQASIQAKPINISVNNAKPNV